MGALQRMFLASDDELLKRGRRARSMVEECFAMESVAAANLALLGRVAAEASA
jgi:hypothetical protein